MATTTQVSQLLHFHGIAVDEGCESSGIYAGNLIETRGCGVSRSKDGEVVICPRAGAAPWGAEPTTRDIVAYGRLRDEAAKVLMDAGLAPYSRIGWRDVIRVAASRDALDILDVETERQLRCYARVTGRTWKSKLRHVWMTGRDEGYDGALRRVRNTIGPSGLDKVRL